MKFIKKKCILFGLALCVSLVSFNCGTGGKTAITKSQETKLDSLISAKNFVITCNWAQPMMTTSMNSIFNSGLFPPGSATNQVNLIGNTNYLKVVGDSVAAELPYFGERQMGGGYNGSRDAGIQFEGVPKAWKVNKDKKSGRYEIRFKTKQASESLNVGIVVFPNLKSSISINSSQRFSIRYSGSLSEIEEE